MFTNFVKMYKEGRKLALLEVAYGAITVLAFFVAGIVALFDQSLGKSILLIPLVSLGTMLMNIFVWSLTKLVAEALDNREKARRAAARDAKLAEKSPAKK